MNIDKGITTDRKKIEILHGGKISGKAEQIWGWGTDAGKIRADRRAELLVAKGSLDYAKFILEIGCGTGEFTRRLAGNSPSNIIAIDISLDLIKEAKKKTGNEKVNFIVADIENLPLKDNVIDSLVGISILHHLDVKTSLSQIKRVLKKGGRIVFSEPNMLNPAVFLIKNIKFIKRRAGDVDSETAFIRWGLKNEFVASGFCDISVKPFDFLHPATPRLLISAIKTIGDILERVPVVNEIAGSLLISGKRS